VPLRLANGATVVAVPILATERLDSLALGGLLTAAALAPSVLVAPLVGVLLDRTRHPRRVVLASALATVVALAVGAFLGDLPIGLVAVALVLGGCASSVFQGGLSSFVVDSIPDERRAYAQDSLSYTLAAIGGPSIVALLTTLASARVAMLALAGLAAVAVLTCAGITMHPRPIRTDATALGTIRAGFRHLVRHRPIAVVTASSTATQLGQGALGVVAVALALDRTGDAADGALLVGGFAIGGVIGAVAANALASRARRAPLVMAVGYVGTGLLTLLAVPDLGFPVAVGAIAASGLFTAPANASMLLLRKQQSPPEVRSQMFTVGAGLRTTGIATGAGLAGAASGLDVPLLVLGMGLVWIVSAVVLVAYPADAPPWD